jgi:hypothetical protein
VRARRGMAVRGTLAQAIRLMVFLGLSACAAGAGLPVISAPDDVIRVQTLADPLLRTLPFKFLGRSYGFHIVGDDRAVIWNVGPGVIYVGQQAARHAADDELAQLIAHALGHDILAHPPDRTDVSDSRRAAEVTAIVAVPGGVVLGGVIGQMGRSSAYTLAHEIEAERIGLRLWLRSGRSCDAWVALRHRQQERTASWHEPIKGVQPPFEALIAMSRQECQSQP